MIRKVLILFLFVLGMYFSIVPVWAVDYIYKATPERDAALVWGAAKQTPPVSPQEFFQTIMDGILDSYKGRSKAETTESMRSKFDTLLPAQQDKICLALGQKLPGCTVP